jgi:hypothetical protein
MRARGLRARHAVHRPARAAGAPTTGAGDGHERAWAGRIHRSSVPPRATAGYLTIDGLTLQARVQDGGFVPGSSPPAGRAA